MTEAPTGDSRARIHRVILDSSEPLTVEDVASQTGLHANTVRGHLDVLLAGETISREPAGAHGRGRPRWLYRAAAPKGSPYQYLAEALTMQLTQARDPQAADRAAERWAHALPDVSAAQSPDEAVHEATAALRRLGFDATTTALGDAISVTACPYADLVDSNPVICDIHASLVARLLRRTGQPVTVEAMEVWTRPGMCVARLRRPDLSPARTITPDEHEDADAPISTEGSTS